MLRSFRALGVWIALDDFGVGYCSLAALRDLSLDVLEIDAGSIQGLTGPNADDRLMRAIIQMAQVLGLDVVAGGVERPDQRDRLLALGCERGPGFCVLQRPDGDLAAGPGRGLCRPATAGAGLRIRPAAGGRARSVPSRRGATVAP